MERVVSHLCFIAMEISNNDEMVYSPPKKDFINKIFGRTLVDRARGYWSMMKLD